MAASSIRFLECNVTNIRHRLQQCEGQGETRTVVAAAVAVAIVGITSELEGEETGRDNPGFRGGDRTTLDLPQEQQDMLEAIKASGKPLVVVLMNGSALSVNWAAQNADAILEAWYPGQEGGMAIAQTLAGRLSAQRGRRSADRACGKGGGEFEDRRPARAGSLIDGP